MRTFIYSLFVLSSLVACQSESKQNNGITTVDPETGDSTQSPVRPAIYQTDECAEEKDLKALSFCGDQALYREINKIVDELDVPIEKWESDRAHVEFLIGANGKVKDPKITISVHPVIDQAILSHLLKSRWQPASFDGEKRELRRSMPIYLE